MSRRCIFTKSFFELGAGDQAAVVDAAIQDLEMAVGIRSEDRRAIRRAIKRIEKKAVLYGIYPEGGSS